MDRRRGPGVRRAAHGRAPVRPAYRSPSYTLARTVETTPPTTTSPTRAGSGPRGGRCARPPCTPGTPGTGRCSARRPAGNASNYHDAYERRPASISAGTGWLRPRGWAGRDWAASQAEHLATRESAGLFDESSFAKLEVRGPRRRRLPGAGVRQPGGARRRRRHVHPGAERPRRDRDGRHRHPAGGRPLQDRHRHGLGQRGPGVAAAAGARRAGRRRRRRRQRGRGLLRALGAALARGAGGRSRPRTCPTPPSPS